MSFSQRALGSWRANRSIYEFYALMWLMTLPVFSLIFVPGRHASFGLAVSVMLSGFVAALAVGMRTRFLAYLQSRAGERRQITWDVMINGVTAGKIDDATYVSLRHEVYSDNRVWAAQIQCYLSSLLKMLARVAYVLPVGVVWGVIALALFRPNDLIATFSAVAHASSSGITTVAHTAINLGIIATLLVGGVMTLVISGAQPNRMLEDAVALNVRARIGVVANGDITLVRFEGSDVFNYSEDERSERRLIVRLERQRRKQRS